ncbi:MAG: hypothetical protein U5R06_08110 [candidate division KSB1 bacterium]|nr:hypothetical protein [candidate division KSB1 bacterium]
MICRVKSFLPLLLLFVSFAVYIGQYVNEFYVPDSDFFDYREKAIAMRNLENPGISKRPPLYSALIALTSTPVKGRNRELYATETINLICAAISFVFLYSIGRHFIGRWAFLLVWAWALHPSTIRMIIKPKAELLLLALGFWAFWLFIRRKRWAYLVGFASTTVRYEGACTVAGIGGSEFFTRRNRIKTVSLSLLSLAFLIAWTFLSSSQGDGQSYTDFYSKGSITLAYLPILLQGTFEFLPNSVYLIPALGGVVLMLYGIVVFMRKMPRETLYLVMYYLAFAVIHMVWFTKNKDYLVIITWDTIFLILLGGYSLATQSAIKQWILKFLQKNKLIIPLVLLVTAEIILLVRFQSAGFRFSWTAFVLFNSALAGFALLEMRRCNLMFALVFLLFSLPVSMGMLRNHSDQFYQIHYAKAEYRLAAEWFADQPKNTRMVISQPYIAQYYSGRDSSTFLNLTQLPNTKPDSLRKWLTARDVTHVAWLYDNRIYESDYSWYQWKLETRGWKTISFLETPEEHPGFEFVSKLGAGNRYALIYKVKP